MNANHVTQWMEAIIMLSDDRFFDLMRLYLGEIKTPFNKQNLVKKLGAFLHKDTVKEQIQATLSNDDVLVLTVISTGQYITKPILNTFFSTMYTSDELYAHLANLEERLIVYKIKNFDNVYCYRMNPYLVDSLEDILQPAHLIIPKKTSTVTAQPLLLTDIMLAGLYTFFFNFSDIFKINGEVKKRYALSLNAIFPVFADNMSKFFLLVDALKAFKLLNESEGTITLNNEYWNSIFELTVIERRLCLLLALFIPIDSDSLPYYVQHFLEFLKGLEPNAFYDKKQLSRFLYLLYKSYADSSAVDNHDFLFSLIDEKSTNNVIDVACMLGCFVEKDGLAAINPQFFEDHINQEAGLLLDASFGVNMLENTHVGQLLPILPVFFPVSIDSTARFEVTRNSCLKYFELYPDSDMLIRMLQENSIHEVPNNILVTIRDWHTKFSEVKVYHGYTVFIKDAKKAVIEQNEEIQRLIEYTIDTGIYLINEKNIGRFSHALKQSGLDFLLQQPRPELAPVKKIPLLARCINTNTPDMKTFVPRMKEEAKNRKQYFITHTAELTEKLAKMPYDAEQKKVITALIKKRIILFPEQLDKITIRLGTYEASGMDFLGKIRLIESALADNHMLEISMPAKKTDKPFLATPISLEKVVNDARLTIKHEDDRMQIVSVAQISHIKLMKISLFS